MSGYQGRVGTKAVQSVLRKATQSNLSMFHHAGNLTDDSILPKPSIKNILNLDNNSTVSMKAKLLEYDKDILQELVGVKLNDFVISFTSSKFIDLDKNLPENIWRDYQELDLYDEFVRLYLDPRKFSRLGYTLNNICQIVFDEYRYSISPDFMGIIDVEVDVNNIEFFIDMQLGGSMNIKDSIVSGLDVYTIGSSISTICKLESIDQDTVLSYDIKDVERMFGIEAARHLIIKLLDDDQYPDIIANFMTRSGCVRALNKSNLAYYNRGFISDLTFERIRNTLINNVTNEAEDDLSTVYSKIWAGKMK